MKADDDWNERPRCANCGHRAVFHHIGARKTVRGSTHRGVPERQVPCSVWVNRAQDPCRCREYDPIPTAAVGE